MWTLYKDYEGWLRLTSPVSPEHDLGADEEKRVRYERAAIESLNDQVLFQHIYITDKELVKVKITPPGMQTAIDQIAERVTFQGWVVATDGEVLSWHSALFDQEKVKRMAWCQAIKERALPQPGSQSYRKQVEIYWSAWR